MQNKKVGISPTNRKRKGEVGNLRRQAKSNNINKRNSETDLKNHKGVHGGYVGPRTGDDIEDIVNSLRKRRGK